MALAIVARCHELGTYSPVLSSRWLAERVTLGHATVSRSLRRLAEDEFLVGKPKRTSEHNYQYRVNLNWAPAQGQTEASSLVPSTWLTLSLNTVSVGHDAFAPKSLGYRAGRIWVATQHPVSAQEIATEYRVSAKTARRDLQGLVDSGLAEKIRDGRVTRYRMLDASTEKLDEIAEFFGTTGWHSRQRETHDRQRDARAYHYQTGGQA
ncbi:DeoR family transcriptional regulator [Amycolatopsis sp. FDAARGOS 1241]|nr:DeoR family transcriptional regulator [Amycolatopsis sp. FDAARGOS 1241]